jgi:type 1 fimbria pilin
VGRYLAAVLLIAGFCAAQGKQSFTGKITDSMCAMADHSHMGMGPTDKDCTIACVMEHGALYVLYDGKKAYELTDQKTPEKFAGQKVTVTGTLDPKTNTIHVDSIVAAK